MDLARAGSDGARPRRDLSQFHLRIRAVPRHGAGAAARASAGRSTPTCTASSSACSTTASACCSRWPTRRPGSAASTSSSSTRTRCASSPPIRSRCRPRRSAPGVRPAGGDARAAGSGLRGGAGVRWAGSGRRRPVLADRPPPRRPHRAHSRPAGRRRSTPPAAATSSARPPARACWPATASKPRSRHATALAAAERGRFAAPAAWRATCAASCWCRDARHRGARAPSTTARSSSSRRRSATWPPEEKLLFDARGAQWASPYGLIGMLTAGQALAEARRERPLFTVPTSDDVKRYWARAGFFTLRRRAVRAARQGAEGGGVGSVRRAARRDAGPGHRGRARGGGEDLRRARRASSTAELGLETKATLRFGMALSEACQNIVEHAGTERLGGGAGVHLPAAAGPARRR